MSEIATARKARCAFFGGQLGRHNECNYGQRLEPRVKNGQIVRCTCEQPSSDDLPFFVFHGEGSREAAEICECSYHRDAHKPEGRACSSFKAQGPQPFDKFYCGCHGWD